MQLEAREVHVWSTDLTITPEQESEKLKLLSSDEGERARQFHFATHRQRFIAARSMLRQIISLYLAIAPQEFVFSYTEHHKPHLLVPDHSRLHFNVAHSHNMAAYAFTLDHAVGIDIEKTGLDYKEDVAKRFFSQREYKELMKLSEKEQIVGFYRLWSRKEAVIKAVGKGLSIPLSSFSVSIDSNVETIRLENENWNLLSLSIHPDYQSALASHQVIKTISYWHFFDHQPLLEKVSRL
jgi:4'-phosphopantetheinyl transferase